MWVSWYEKNRTHREEQCESIDRDYLKVKISLEFTAALAMKQRTDGTANRPRSAKTLEMNRGANNSGQQRQQVSLRACAKTLKPKAQEVKRERDERERRETAEEDEEKEGKGEIERQQHSAALRQQLTRLNLFPLPSSFISIQHPSFFSHFSGCTDQR